MTSVVAIHVGADLLSNPEHAGWQAPRFCGDTVTRLSRLCRDAGVRHQHLLQGAQASLGVVRETIAHHAGRTQPGGLLIISFSGHSARPVPGSHVGGWALGDGVLYHDQTARMLAAVPPQARIVVLTVSCYAAAFAGVLPGLAASTVLVAACGTSQAIVNWPVSEFVTTLERLTFPGGTPNADCVSYNWLCRELRRDTPDTERPEILASHPAALQHRPFAWEPSQ